MAGLLLSGCDTLFFLADLIPEDNSGLLAEEDANQEPAETAEPVTASTQAPIDLDMITVWVQPLFDPSSDDPGSRLLADHIQQFVETHPGVKVEFRVKAAEGANSLLNALSITAQAAPDALPTIVLLSRQDMEAAAASGLIRPIAFYSSALDNNDWYPFANKMGKYHNEVFGLPFTADVILLASRIANPGRSYTALQDINRQFGNVGFAAGNPTPLVPYLWYQSGGGTLSENQEQPSVDKAVLENLFVSIEEARRLGIFTSSIMDYQNEKMAWDAFINGDLSKVITRFSNVRLASEPVNVFHVSGLGQSPFTYAYGWVWCLVQKDNTDIDLNVEFMQHLISPEFLAAWIAETSYSPVRPSSLESLGTDMELLDRILLSAEIIPPRSVRSLTDALLSSAMDGLLRGTISADAALEEMIAKMEEMKAQ